MPEKITRLLVLIHSSKASYKMNLSKDATRFYIRKISMTENYESQVYMAGAECHLQQFNKLFSFLTEILNPLKSTASTDTYPLLPAFSFRKLLL